MGRLTGPAPGFAPTFPQKTAVFPQLSDRIRLSGRRIQTGTRRFFGESPWEMTPERMPGISLPVASGSAAMRLYRSSATLSGSPAAGRRR